MRFYQYLKVSILALNKDFLRNVSANSLSFLLILFFQIVSIPVFISSWGVNLYGQWLILSSFIAYFQMSEIGLNSATNNSFVFSFINGDYEKCRLLINNNIFFISFVFVVISVLLILFEYFGHISSLFSDEFIKKNIYVCLFLLLFQVIIGTYNNLLNTIYNASKNIPRGVMIDNFIRAAEYCVTFFVIFSGYTILFLLFSVVVVKLFGIIYKLKDSSQYYKLEINFKYFSSKELKKIILPSFSFFLFPLANSFTFQGLIFVINNNFGSTYVVLYSTLRTLVNFGKSVLDILHKSIFPYITIAYSNNILTQLIKIHIKTIALSIVTILCLLLFFLAFGEMIYVYWTEKKIQFDYILFYLLLSMLFTNTIWSSNALILQATNNLKSFSVVYLFVNLNIFIFSIFLLPKFATIYIIPILIIIGDIVLIYFSIWNSLKLTNLKKKDFLNFILYKYNR